MKLFAVKLTLGHWLALSALVLGSLAVRLCLFDFESGDIRGCLVPWSEFIRAHGGVRALGREIGNYPPLYYYLLTVASYLPLPRVYAIKALSVAFDYVLAGYVVGIVRQRYQTGLKPIAAGLATLFLPTVVLNSSLWGQCDAMYASGIAACLYYLLRRKQLLALTAYGLACSLKPQALFFAPLLIVLVRKEWLPPLLLYVVPAVYLAAALPAWLLGRPIGALLLLYLNQGSAAASSLTLGATNLCQWVPADYSRLFFPAAMVLTLVAVVGFIVFLGGHRTGSLSDETLVSAALVLLVLVPFILPAMHERYFYPADALGVAFAFWFPRRWMIPVLIESASFFTYLPYLFNQEPVPRPILALVMGAALVLATRHLLETLRPVPPRSTSDDAAQSSAGSATPQTALPK